MSVTMKDVARRARVSVATVSRVLNGKGPVLEKTRTRIQTTIETLGYAPHGAARSLITRRTNTLGVLLPDIYGEFFSELIRGIDGAVRKAGYHLLVTSSHGDRGETAAVFRAMRGRVDGLVVLSPDMSVPAVRASIPDSLPVVLLNSPSEDAGPFDLINIDNSHGAAQMVRHFHDLGHRRIAFIRGPLPNADAADRLRGFRAAMRELGMPVSEELELPGNFREDGGFRAGQRIAGMARPPTAIFAANDAMAIGCLAALRAQGRSVPGDFSLSGFDDIPIASFTAPPADLGPRLDRRARRGRGRARPPRRAPGQRAQTAPQHPSHDSRRARIHRIRARSKGKGSIEGNSRKEEGRMNRRTRLPRHSVSGGNRSLPFLLSLALAVFLAVTLGSPPAFAQLTTGTLRGIVADESGAPLPGVVIEATNDESGTTRSLVSGTDGFYNLILSPGSYTIKASLEGYGANTRKVVVQVGQTQNLDFLLSLRATQDVVVSASAAVIETAQSEISTNVTEQQLQVLPAGQPQLPQLRAPGARRHDVEQREQPGGPGRRAAGLQHQRLHRRRRATRTTS